METWWNARQIHNVPAQVPYYGEDHHMKEPPNFFPIQKDH